MQVSWGFENAIREGEIADFIGIEMIANIN